MEGKFGNGVSGIRTILWLTLASKREQANQEVWHLKQGQHED
jgi:hypothetical protein